MKTISALGSCRIVTPMRRGAERYGYKVNQKKNYGFVHSTPEAVQQVNFMMGNWQPGPEHWRLIAPKAQLDVLRDLPFRPSDLYIVEISSLKKVTIPTGCLQINYLGRALPRAFENPQLTKRFWASVQTGDAAEIADVVSAMQAEDLVGAEDAKILNQVRMEIMEAQSVRNDVRWLDQQPAASDLHDPCQYPQRCGRGHSGSTTSWLKR